MPDPAFMCRLLPVMVTSRSFTEPLHIATRVAGQVKAWPVFCCR
jgi:hypothetical protein